MTHAPLAQQLEHALTDHPAVETLAGEVQPAVQAALNALPPALVDALHGKRLGHALHPALVHLPLGGWLVAGLLDFWPGRTPERERAAQQALLIGTLGGVPALAAGWTDWAGTRGAARRTGLVHGLLNETAFVLNVASLLARRRRRAGLGRVLSGTALVLALTGGALGGELVYRHDLGRR